MIGTGDPGKRGGTWRLRDGVHVFAESEGSWLLTPDGDTFLRLQVASAVMEGALAALSGSRAGPSASEAEGVLDVLREAGLIEPVPEPAAPPGARVEVRGTTSIATACAQLLRAAGAQVVTLPDLRPRAARDAPDVAVLCAGWLADAALSAYDRWAATAGVAWHWCHREGDRYHLGPFVVPGHTAGYADTRARRLAAADRPDELRRYWAFLDSPGAVGPPVPGDAGSTATVAGALVTDVLAHLDGRPLPSQGDQLAFTPSRAAWTRHPVLALPTGLMTAVPA